MQKINGVQKLFKIAKKYYEAVSESRDTVEMKKELDKAMLPFANDTAFYAVIEQLNIKNDYKNNKK